MSALIKNRYDFVLLFDVLDGNPNGDPDAGNLPRLDPDTNQGLVTDVCLKRKIRNRIQLTQSGKPGYDIFVKEGDALNAVIKETCKNLGTTTKKEGVLPRTQRMCATFYDIRTFGAVLTTNAEEDEKKDAKLFYNCGQVRGPVQFTFARSVDPIVTIEHSITRVAITKEEDRDRKDTEMGRKNTVPYGLYKAHGFIVPSFAARTGFSEEDLKIFWEAVKMMFVDDPSAARGTMTVRRIIVFKHESALGNAQAAELFERVKIERASNDEDKKKPARAYSDYTVKVYQDKKCTKEWTEGEAFNNITLVPESELGQ